MQSNPLNEVLLDPQNQPKERDWKGIGPQCGGGKKYHEKSAQN